MWESRLSGSERGWSATLIGMTYCGTAGKPGGKQRKQTSSYSQGSLQPTRTTYAVARRLQRLVRSLYDCPVKNLHPSYCRWINRYDALWSIASKIRGVACKDMRHMMDKHCGSKACVVRLNTRHAIIHNQPSPLRVDCR